MSLSERMLLRAMIYVPRGSGGRVGWVGTKANFFSCPEFKFFGWVGWCSRGWFDFYYWQVDRGLASPGLDYDVAFAKRGAEISFFPQPLIARYLFHFWLDSICYEKRLFSELRTIRRNHYLKAVDYVIHGKLRDSWKTTWWFMEN